MKLCGRLWMGFGRNFCEKNDKFGYLNPISGKLHVTHDLGWWLVGKPMVDFLFAWIQLFFAIYYGSGVMRQSVYSSAVLQGVDLIAFQFYLGRVVPISHSWRQKTRNTGLPDGEDRIPLCSLVLTQCRSVTDRQTDVRTDIRICSNIIPHLQS